MLKDLVRLNHTSINPNIKLLIQTVNLIVNLTLIQIIIKEVMNISDKKVPWRSSSTKINKGVKLMEIDLIHQLIIGMYKQWNKKRS